LFRFSAYRPGIARLLFGLYVAILANGIIFRHAHRLSDGTIVCHAHPYKNSSGTRFPDHTHSLDELVRLDAFTNALYESPGTFVWQIVIAVVLLLNRFLPVRTLTGVSLTHLAFQHRGPPVQLI
jgi:hypothetical protein